ncbi:MAG: hypothetical protein JWO48_465 [Bryobacterales bacterium]|nr:hypothetical protein [Bryobacterales bacterium]
MRHVAIGVLLIWGGTLLRAQPADYRFGSLERDDWQPIYADVPGDSWNRIFYHLFTRTLSVRLSSEFPDAQPLTSFPTMGFPSFAVSVHLFQRIEAGDRAIDPLYPSFLSSAGARQVLEEPRYSLFCRALEDALGEEGRRSIIARALMQSDIWSAFDIIYRVRHARTGDSKQLDERRDKLLITIARFIRKIALTQDEIGALPDNYTPLSRAYQLPDLFQKESAWMEVQWIPNRLHDRNADFRRVAHVFIKAALPIRDKQRFLNDLRREDLSPHAALDGVALVIRPLVIDRNANVVPTPLVTEVQFRVFQKDRDGGLVKTELQQYELSRRLSVISAASGGLTRVPETAPAYLPASGNDYGFASAQSGERALSSPILATMRTRCVACHGEDGETVFTLRTHGVDPVRQINARFDDDCARYVASQKVQREDWTALRREWSRE